MPRSSEPVEPAPFSLRVFARAIDLGVNLMVALVAGTIAGVIFAVLSAKGVVGADWQEQLSKPSAISFLLSMIASIMYDTFTEGLGGATVGKAVLGLRARGEDLSPCSLGSAHIRSLAYFIDALFCGLVAYASMSGSPMQQRLGDRWGKTVVVKASSLERRGEPLPEVVGGICTGLAVSFFTILMSMLARAL